MNKLKYVLFSLILNILISISMFSQNNCADTLMYQFQNIKLFNGNTSLISESNYYEAKLLKKARFDKGYGYTFQLRIYDTCYAKIFVVSIDEKTINYFNETNELKIGQNYKIKLIDYFENYIPLSIEYKFIYDVMLGYNKVSILSGVVGNLFSKIFVSPNIIDKYYLDSLQTKISKENYNLIYSKLHEDICSFIRSITFLNYSDSIKYNINKFKLKKSLINHFLPIIHMSPSHKFNKNSDNKLPKKHPHRKSFNYLKYKSFNPLLSEMLYQYYKLPITDSLDFFENFTCNNVSIKVVYFFNGVITVRVKWNLSQSEQYIAILSLKNYNGSYKVIGFNQPTSFINNGYSPCLIRLESTKDVLYKSSK